MPLQSWSISLTAHGHLDRGHGHRSSSSSSQNPPDDEWNQKAKDRLKSPGQTEEQSERVDEIGLSREGVGAELRSAVSEITREINGDRPLLEKQLFEQTTDRSVTRVSTGQRTVQRPNGRESLEETRRVTRAKREREVLGLQSAEESKESTSPGTSARRDTRTSLEGWLRTVCTRQQSQERTP